MKIRASAPTRSPEPRSTSVSVWQLDELKILAKSSSSEVTLPAPSGFLFAAIMLIREVGFDALSPAGDLLIEFDGAALRGDPGALLQLDAVAQQLKRFMVQELTAIATSPKRDEILDVFAAPADADAAPAYDRNESLSNELSEDDEKSRLEESNESAPKEAP